MPAVVHPDHDDLPRVRDGFFLSRGRQCLCSRSGEDVFVDELRLHGPSTEQESTQGHQANTASSRTQETSGPRCVPSS
jgi:hypothetical protein